MQPIMNSDEVNEARDNGWEIDKRGIERSLKILSGLKLVVEQQPVSA